MVKLGRLRKTATQRALGLGQLVVSPQSFREQVLGGGRRGGFGGEQGAQFTFSVIEALGDETSSTAASSRRSRIIEWNAMVVGQPRPCKIAAGNEDVAQQTPATSRD